ncbi:LEU2-Beta-isopropyl-malate dehydrogenase [Fusarium fujikuroi]|uniref:LEU2-Beta-isopropyl-malate dehydrogenase n=1 Tax=Gibberella fujikuroi (strain CBS 195.34 / IMI 58289 / NRRL A-6831) TaxID=1279085 RepID=S0DV01_GIBF5|nr:LEU2-Beta-isopropyl-malate dehydrogenase [Fusarium fujikuroi IMI 58289]SCN78641.1 LEU2-Beta-isopropyl-malate dehydrogenase [Fusarium fujikuroi]CCT66296.1 LEU2-Beta-isopropyl-malate dehydrogenase [Fusarium fujikuroi IMI 58289]SCN80682.1 LEU2-Beta-isopropyl-malate dehydrogenase [Fusarium fujikuroi]SCN81591.1 LEU2-Beta-isopropyl-malate dehydrogenase [Fusarium fujikuroi]SCN97032.1 LEU2-Beta-isopropyl-malate dehydrogenase [Fusarium fujikuroi]
MTLTSSLVGQCLECPLPLALPQGPSGPDHSGKSRPTEFTGMAPILEWWGSNRGPANKVGHSSLCLVLLLLQTNSIVSKLIQRVLNSRGKPAKRWQVEPLKPSYGPFSSDSLSAPSMPMAPLTDETIAAAKSADAVLLGGPECGNGAVRPEPGLLKLRKGMDIYGKLWPCFFASGSLVDACLPEASVCCGTVLSSSLYTPALFTLASVNSGSDETQNLTPIPRLGVLTIWLGSLPVVAATRSIGLLPSANLSHILDIKGVPKLFGTILSVAMILCYSLNLPVEAKAVEGVIRMALEGGLHAKDLGGNTTTEEVGDAVFQELEKIPKA